jgi:hypothetical protein
LTTTFCRLRTSCSISWPSRRTSMRLPLSLMCKAASATVAGLCPAVRATGALLCEATTPQRARPCALRLGKGLTRCNEWRPWTAAPHFTSWRSTICRATSPASGHGSKLGDLTDTTRRQNPQQDDRNYRGT